MSSRRRGKNGRGEANTKEFMEEGGSKTPLCRGGYPDVDMGALTVGVRLGDGNARCTLTELSAEV